MIYKTKSDLAYAEVRQRILSGAIPPGSLLPQRQLAESLGMSLTPLREALKRLMSEGLVELESHRDARVSAISSQEINDFMDLRLALDPFATALAAERHTDADAAAMKESFSRLLPVTRDQGDAALTAHRDFHEAIYRGSHNPRLIHLLDEIWDLSDRYRRLGLSLPESSASREQDHEEHEDLLRLVLARRGEDAHRLMEGHVRRSVIGLAAEGLAGN
ncbi:GntR family transcriptional regulator [Arthrobacter sp. 260]|uniref:FCD domain-containing protein n=1 Tax=Arthrobacter sp. 260 TaxID=2735314 RepID=UPI001491AD8E|nr:GntR family transcriptional regulator [Arthrobacter sp. 260]